MGLEAQVQHPVGLVQNLPGKERKGGDNATWHLAFSLNVSAALPNARELLIC